MRKPSSHGWDLSLALLAGAVIALAACVVGLDLLWIAVH